MAIFASLILVGIACFFAGRYNLRLAKIAPFPKDLLNWVLGWVLSIGGVIGSAVFSFTFILGLIEHKDWKETINRKNKEAQEYNLRAEKHNDEEEQKYNARQSSLNQQYEIVKSSLNEAKETRKKIYALDIVNPKYRNLVAISSLYDYIDTGLCETLAGPNQAYMTYEYMSRLGTIISQLNVAIQQLEQIKENQYRLYDAITESNQLSKTLLQEIGGIKTELSDQHVILESIAQDNAQAVEYNRISAINTECLKWIEISKLEQRRY